MRDIMPNGGSMAAGIAGAAVLAQLKGTFNGSMRDIIKSGVVAAFFIASLLVFTIYDFIFDNLLILRIERSLNEYFCFSVIICYARKLGLRPDKSLRCICIRKYTRTVIDAKVYPCSSFLECSRI